MKKDMSITTTVNTAMNPVQARIKLFYDNGFFSKEIAMLTGLPKKLIKSISKGECIPEGGDCNRLILLFDETITRLHISEATIYNGLCSEADLDTEGKIKYKLNVTRVTLYKGTDDKQMIVTIHGDIANP